MVNNEDMFVVGFLQCIIMEDVVDVGLIFGVYYQNFFMFLFYLNMWLVKYVNNFIDYELRFKVDVVVGILFNYVVIEVCYFDMVSSFVNDDYLFYDVFQGQLLFKEVYEMLCVSLQWESFLFVIIYDEYGGFYDYVFMFVIGVLSFDGIDGVVGIYSFKFD